MGVSHALWHARVRLCVCLQINTTHNISGWGSTGPVQITADYVDDCSQKPSKVSKMKCISSFLSSGHDKSPPMSSDKKVLSFCCWSQPWCCRGHSGSLTLLYHGAISPAVLQCNDPLQFHSPVFLCDSGVRLALTSFVPQQETWGWTTLWQIKGYAAFMLFVVHMGQKGKTDKQNLRWSLENLPCSSLSLQ